MGLCLSAFRCRRGHIGSESRFKRYGFTSRQWYIATSSRRCLGGRLGVILRKLGLALRFIFF